MPANLLPVLASAGPPPSGLSPSSLAFAAPAGRSSLRSFTAASSPVISRPSSSRSSPPAPASPPFTATSLQEILIMKCLNTRTIRKLEFELCQTIPCKVPSGRLCLRPRSLTFPHHYSTDYPGSYKSGRLKCHIHQYWRYTSFRTFALSVNLDEEPLSLSKGDHLNNISELASEDEEFPPQKLESHELKSLLADSERAKLLRKLSEANQYNRFLRRQLLIKDDALVSFKTELAFLELELQTLIGLAEEIANSGTYTASRKINGKFVSSYLLSRLEAVRENVKEHIKDIDSVKVKDIAFFWVGMAESVQVMGSFDGWTQGEEMSPEYTGSYTRFSTTMRLRPGRYEIKFLVDGEWQLSPELPTVGEGLLQNNLLVVE